MHPSIDAYAEHIMGAIADDVAEGVLPARVRTFADLHDYLDANDYIQDAAVPCDGTQATLEVIALVQQEVTRRLSAPSRPYCTYGTCTYPLHDHTTTIGPDGEELGQSAPMRCEHCGQPAHHDDKLRRYRHDDPNAPDCFLIREPT
jgi:hypothetical protein